jgi:hypothetical protein
VIGVAGIAGGENGFGITGSVALAVTDGVGVRGLGKGTGAGVYGEGGTTGAGISGKGGSTAPANFGTRQHGAGVDAVGGVNAAHGVVGQGGGGTVGVSALPYANIGVLGVGAGGGSGIVGVSAGANGAVGIIGEGSDGFNSTGVLGLGKGTAPGVEGQGGATGHGGTFTGKDTGLGVLATGGDNMGGLRANSGQFAIGLNGSAGYFHAGNARAVYAYNESGDHSVEAFNGDGGPALWAHGAHGYASNVAKIEVTPGNGTPSYAALEILSDASQGIYMETTGAVGAGLFMDCQGGGPGIGVSITGAGTGLEVNTSTGPGIVATVNGGNYALNVNNTSTSTLGALHVTSNAAGGHSATITNTNVTGTPLKVTGVGNMYKVIEIAGVTPPISSLANNSINVANLTRAWLALPGLDDTSLSSGSSFSVASVACNATGRLTINFAAGVFPTASYVPSITWFMNSTGMAPPSVKLISQTTTAFVVDVYTGGTASLIDLTVGALGVNIVFIGCGS